MITHDLGVIAQLCHRIAVMYAGEIVEVANAEILFESPAHPYTIGLLRATPRLDKVIERMIAIDGVPPNLINPPAGCPFAARCRHAVEECTYRVNSLAYYEKDHWVSCWRASERKL